MYKISKNNIHIKDSYKLHKKSEMLSIINEIRSRYSEDECLPLKRTNKSLLNEWAAHNLVYDLHMFRSHTKDVDLDYPQKWYFTVGYFIFGNLYRMFH